jgi:hypothetical protein
MFFTDEQKVFLLYKMYLLYRFWSKLFDIQDMYVA